MAVVVTTPTGRDRLGHGLLSVVLEGWALRDKGARQRTKDITVSGMDVAGVFIVTLRGIVVFGEALVDRELAAFTFAHK